MDTGAYRTTPCLSALLARRRADLQDRLIHSYYPILTNDPAVLKRRLHRRHQEVRVRATALSDLLQVNAQSARNTRATASLRTAPYVTASEAQDSYRAIDCLAFGAC